jgi:ribosomal protein S12 methylthiotransferase
MKKISSGVSPLSRGLTPLKKIAVISCGCPKNQVDTEITLGYLDKAGYRFTPEWRAAEVLLLNTCAFIQSARAEARQNIQEMINFKNRHPEKKLVVFGCWPQLEMESLKKLYPEVDGFLGVGVAAFLPGLLKKIERGEKVFWRQRPRYLYGHKAPRIPIVSDLNDDVDLVVARPPFAYLKIAEGCSNHCRYCLVPQIRGPYRSRPLESVVKEAQCLAEKGAREIILVAQDTTAYGEDLYGQKILPKLLKRLVKINMVKWIRILYNHPEKITDELIEVVAQQPKICQYFDLPFQHVSRRILKAMGRKGDMKIFLDLLGKLRKLIKGVTIRSSFMIGFPEEESRDQKLLLDFLTEAKVDRAGFFIYSREENTPAGRMSRQVPEVVKKARFEEACRKQSRISLSRNKKLVGTKTEVIIEGRNPGFYFGRTRSDAPEVDGKIFLSVPPGQSLFPGQIVQALVTGARMYDLVGEAC